MEVAAPRERTGPAADWVEPERAEAASAAALADPPALAARVLLTEAQIARARTP
jgi:hypothetical protein